jgi:carboxyl-terminal processing protease
MTTLLLVTLLATPSSPPSVSATKAVKSVTNDVAAQYAQHLMHLIQMIPETYLVSVPEEKLVRAATEGLFKSRQIPVPSELERILSDADVSLRVKCTRARILAGDVPELAGVRAFIRSANALSAVLDSGCTISLYHSGSFTISDLELIGGFELDGVSLVEWQAYRVENGPQSNWAEPPPIPLPWRVKRVTPGMVAAKADLQPNDVILSVGGTIIKRENAALAILPLLVPLSGQNFPEIGSAMGKSVTLEIERAGKRQSLVLDIPQLRHEEAPREMVFGHKRRRDGTWDYFTNAQDRIAYLRLSVFDNSTPEILAHALTQITNEKPRAMLLDLRWTPGGLLHAGGRACSLFLRPEQPLAKLTWRNTARQGENLERMFEGTVDPIWTKLPLAVLTNNETYGGGETIAAAIQDNKRGIVMGQRTPGRGLIVGTLVPEIPGLRYRITTAKIDRATGKSRHRYDTSGPLDDWGVRPDPGFEIPTTPEMTKKLREQYEQKTIRPNGATVAVALDDPHADPQLEIALKLLKEKILAKGK